MNNYIYCGDKILFNEGLIQQEFVSLDDLDDLDDISMSKVCISKEAEEERYKEFLEKINLYDFGDEEFEKRIYDKKNKIIELGLSDEAISSVKREFKELEDFHIPDEEKEKYLRDAIKVRKRV